MQNPLIAAAPKLQGNILQFLNKFPVHQNINARKHTIRVRRIDLTARSQVTYRKDIRCSTRWISPGKCS